ncbi:MAG: substrate-binding domain-containing protein [Planctomycetes bacterium]|nr:substrate-binding domain-containing protein [Planctomycetota bacterium]
MHRLAWVLLACLAGCAREAAVAGTTDHAPPVAVPPARPHRIVVWSTDSMRDAMARLARHYETAVPGAKVEVWCAGGAELLAKRTAGGPCDVLVIGDSSQMSRFAAAAHLAAGSPAELARSRIAIVTAAGNPQRITGLRDLVRPGLRLAFGQRSSSIGRYTRWALSHLLLEAAPAVELPTAAAVLAAVRDGKADAGVVYTTTFADAGAAVARVDVPPDENQPVLYSISVDREAQEPAGAAAFRAVALSDAGQAILRDCGFLPPGAK